MNRFEQVSSDGIQMSLAVVSPMSHIYGGVGVPCLMSAGGRARGHVKMRFNASWVMVTWDPPCGQTSLTD